MLELILFGTAAFDQLRPTAEAHQVEVILVSLFPAIIVIVLNVVVTTALLLKADLSRM